MTENTYGLTVTETDENYAWEEWEWQDYTGKDIVIDLSVAAARTVLDDIFTESWIRIECGPKGCFVRVKLGQGLGELATCLVDLIDHWVKNCGANGEPTKYLEAALETALAKLRRLPRPSPGFP